jgi:hypothetical protein
MVAVLNAHMAGNTGLPWEKSLEEASWHLQLPYACFGSILELLDVVRELYWPVETARML